MKQLLFALAVVVVVAGGGWYVWRTFYSAPAAAPIAAVPADTQTTYASSTLGVSFMYPPAYTLNAQYAYDLFGPNKLINGFKVTIPASMAMASTSSPQAGTNLSADTYLSVEQLPRAKRCTADIYLTANVTAHAVSEGGTDYSFASSSGVAAGNRYEEQVYALATSTPCTAVRYFIHYAAIENFPADTVQEFDRTALLADFDKIRHSLFRI